MFRERNTPTRSTLQDIKTSSHRCISVRSGCRPFCPTSLGSRPAPTWAWSRPEPWHFLVWACDGARTRWCCKVRRRPAVYCRPKCLWWGTRRWRSSGRSRPRRAAAAAGETAASSAAGCCGCGGCGGDAAAAGCPGPDAHPRRAPWWPTSGTRGPSPQCLCPSLATGSPGSWNPRSCCRGGENLRSSAPGCQS